MQAPSGAYLETEDFALALDGDWQQHPTAYAEQYSFTSREKRSSLVLSVMQASNLRRERLIEVATRLAQARLQAECIAFPGHTLSFGHKWVALQPGGLVAEVAYAGSNYTAHSYFRFLGYVTEQKILSLWVCTTTGDDQYSKQVFDEVQHSFSFSVP
jgi:hypothetical protein